MEQSDGPDGQAGGTHCFTLASRAPYQQDVQASEFAVFPSIHSLVHPAGNCPL